MSLPRVFFIGVLVLSSMVVIFLFTWQQGATRVWQTASGIVLLTHFLHDSVEARNALQLNLNNRHIRAILLTASDETAVASLSQFANYRKIKKVIVSTQRWSFRDYFMLGDRYLPAHQIIMVANSDIFYDDTLNTLRHVNMTGRAYSVGSYHQTDRPYPNCSHGSQDSWILSV